MRKHNNIDDVPKTKSESKYFNTAKLMDEALISLLEVKAFEYISVKEICARAGVNRSTFYLHYDTISDLLEETVTSIHQKLFDYYKMDAKEFIHKIQTENMNDLILINRDFLTPYLMFVRDNKNIFIACKNNPLALDTDTKYSNIKKYLIGPIMDKFQVPKEEQHYWMAFYIHGVNAIISEWIKNKCEDDLDNVIDAIIHCVRPHKKL